MRKEPGKRDSRRFAAWMPCGQGVRPASLSLQHERSRFIGKKCLTIVLFRAIRGALLSDEGAAVITGSGWRRGGGPAARRRYGATRAAASTRAGLALAGPVPRALSPRPLGAGRAFGAKGCLILRSPRERASRRRSIPHEQGRGGSKTRAPRGGPRSEPRRKIGSRLTPRAAGRRGTGRLFLEWFRGVPRHPLHFRTRAERIARAMGHVHASSSGGAQAKTRGPQD